jgi:lipoate-protein ligase A
LLYVDNSSNDPEYNLAFEESLFDISMRCGDITATLWVNSPSVIVGRFQNTHEEVNVSYAMKHNIKIVRRVTGGGAVYHDLNNMNYSFVIPPKPSYDEDINRLLDELTGILRKLGVSAKRSGRNDLTVDGRKFSGTAQFLSPKGALLHGTLLFDTDLSVLSEVLNVDADKYVSKGLKSVRGRVTNLSRYFDERYGLSDLKRDIVSRLDCSIMSLSPEDLELAARLHKEKYSTWEWNYGVFPGFTKKQQKRFPWGKVEVLWNIRNGVVDRCKVYGDFFGDGIETLESLFSGVQYDNDELSKVLGDLPLGTIFAGSCREEVVDFFLS